MTPTSESGLQSLTIASFAEKTAERTPTPGGGSVLAMQAGMSIGLLSMVLTYSDSNKRSDDEKSLLSRSIARLQSLRIEALACADRDAEAYGRLNDQLKAQPRDTEQLRDAAMASIEVPITLMEIGSASLAIAAECASCTNRYLASDLKIACELLLTITAASKHLVLANAPTLQDLRSLTDEIDRADAALGRAKDAQRAVVESLE